MMIVFVLVGGDGHVPSVHGTRTTPNTVESFDSFPNEDYPDLKQHKIVKKQMGVAGEPNIVSRTKNIGYSPGNDDDIDNDRYKAFSKGVHSYHEGSTLLNEINGYDKYRDSKYDNMKGWNAKGFHTDDSEKKDGNVLINRIMKRNIRIDADGANKKHDKESMSSGVQSKIICKIRDSLIPSHVYEYRSDDNENFKWTRKRYPLDEVFSRKYFESRQTSYPEALNRRSRQNMFLYYSKKPEDPCPPDGDSEPANEWLDATQGTGSKIPSEFKPKPKLKLKIYHLRCKKALNHERPLIKPFRNRYVPYRSTGAEAARSSAYLRREKTYGWNVRRHQTRSFQIRPIKKENDQDENLSEFKESDVEDDEEDEDDEEEDDENDEEAGEESNASERSKEKDGEKVSCKEGLKDLFRTAKEAVVNRVRFNEPSPTSQFNGKSNFAAKKTEPPHESENKVLIDANIKVDGEISNALKNILGKVKMKKDN